MRLVVLYRCKNSTVGKTTGTGTFGTDNFVFKYITSISLILLLAPVPKL